MTPRALLATCIATLLVSCKKPAPGAEVSPGAGPSATAVARTAPAPSGSAAPELVPGTAMAYGLPLPRSMRVVASFPGEIHAVGDVASQDVTKYVQDRLDAARVELSGAGLVFPAARVRGGDASKVLRVEVNPAGTRTELVVKDVTPVPKRAPDTSIPEAERWRRAGLNPDGTPLDPMTQR